MAIMDCGGDREPGCYFRIPAMIARIWINEIHSRFFGDVVGFNHRSADYIYNRFLELDEKSAREAMLDTMIDETYEQMLKVRLRR